MKYNYASIKRTRDNDLKSELLSRYIEKRIHKTKPLNSIASIQDDWHRVYYHDGDSWTEFALFEGDDCTDEEISEYVNSMRIRINSPYDCTGKVFTEWINWHRNPNGWISVIHHKAIDC